MVLILIGLFLTFAAFALDIGNYYLWKLRVDKIARAAASAGLGKRALDGYETTREGGGYNVTTAMNQVIDESFKSYGVTSQWESGEWNYLIETSTLELFTADRIYIGLTYRAPMILLDKVVNALGYGFSRPPNAIVNQRGGFATGYPNVRSAHAAQLSATNIVLLLDVSGSMLCPSQGDCSCRRTNTCNANIDTKLALMARGVSNFVKMFNPDRDRIAVIPFNLAAQRLYSFTVGGGNQPNSAQTIRYSPSLNAGVTNEFAWDVLTNDTILQGVLTSLAGSNTNHCDALAEGILELENLSTALYGASGYGSDRRRLQPFVVFFTDGAPNAMRGIFGQATGAPPATPCLTYGGNRSYSAPRACSSQDMYHYALEWVHGENGTPQQYRGPGPFVVRETNGFVPTIFRHQISGQLVAPLNSEVCGQHSPDPRRFEQTITKVTGGGAGGRGHATLGCLNSRTFSFAIPYTDVSPNEGQSGGPYQAIVRSAPISTADTTWRDPNWPPSFFVGTPSANPAPATYGIQKYDELPYYCAIEAADFIRTRYGATIFTIGLGPTAVHDNAGFYNSATCSDPLQDADDHTGRKDFFLSRLAFSSQMFQDPALPVTVPVHYQIKGDTAQGMTRDVTNCQTTADANHRFNTGTVALLPPFNVGYTSNSGLQDGPTTYQDLRPRRPAWEDPHTPARRIDTQGEYFPTNTPGQVPSIFSNIAKKILLRAVS
jgi:hypothetical protein